MKRLRKILKVLGLLVLALLVVLAIAAFWFVRRGWSQTEGEITVAGLTAPVEVVRDAWGVPHIYAANEADLFFAQGYVHAQDRLWQMELNRHLSGGRMAELFGRPALETDRYLRTLGMRRNAERSWQLLEPETRSFLESYARGVNAYLESHRGALPVEFTILGARPQPWTPIDCLAWAETMGLSLGQNHAVELKRVALAAKLGEQRARQLLPPYPAEGAVIVPPGEGGYPAVEPGPETPGGPLLASLLGPPAFSRGSNNWVVHGSRTTTGKPILANDTHLGLNMPSEWYENGLHAGRFDVVGFSMAGLPFVVIGHNQRVAWGITAMNGDTQDLYVETFDAQKRRYQAGDQWQEPQRIHEQIPLKSGQKVDLEIVVTRHGPIINDVSGLTQSPPMALRWAAADGNRFLDALPRMNLAKDWPSFREALSLWGSPTLNFVYADVDGNIGYQAAGNIPLRAPGDEGLVPMPGAGGEHDWRGYVPFAEMPSVLNPKAGFVASANNKVVADSYPHFIAHDYADPYRATRITEVLAAGRKVSVDDMKRLQADTVSPTAPKLRPYLKAVKPENDLQKRALEQVERWDGHMNADSPGATIFYTWYFHLLPDIGSDELGEELARVSRAMFFGQTPLYIRLMETPDAPWFERRADPRQGDPGRHRPPQLRRGGPLARRAPGRRSGRLAVGEDAPFDLQPSALRPERHRAAHAPVQRQVAAARGRGLYGQRRNAGHQSEPPLPGELRPLAASDRRPEQPERIAGHQQHRPEPAALPPPPRGPDPPLGPQRVPADALQPRSGGGGGRGEVDAEAEVRERATAAPASSGRSHRPDLPVDRRGEATLRLFEVEVYLQPEPEALGRPEVAGQPERRFARSSSRDAPVRRHRATGCTRSGASLGPHPPPTLAAPHSHLAGVAGSCAADKIASLHRMV